MLSLILALTVVGAQPATEPAAEPQPAAKVTKVSKADLVTCKWRTNAGGQSLQVCMTNREWRQDQIENQRRVDDFQKRALHTQPR